jgi:predicted permease
VVESSRSEGVFGNVKSLGFEDFTGLFSESFAQVVVVDSNAGNVTLVAWEYGSFASNRGLERVKVRVLLP